MESASSLCSTPGRMYISELSIMYQWSTILVSAWSGKDAGLQFVVLLLTSSDPSTFYWILQTRSFINKHLITVSYFSYCQ